MKKRVTMSLDAFNAKFAESAPPPAPALPPPTKPSTIVVRHSIAKSGQQTQTTEAKHNAKPVSVPAVPPGPTVWEKRQIEQAERTRLLVIENERKFAEMRQREAERDAIEKALAEQRKVKREAAEKVLAEQREAARRERELQAEQRRRKIHEREEKERHAAEKLRKKQRACKEAMEQMLLSQVWVCVDAVSTKHDGFRPRVLKLVASSNYDELVDKVKYRYKEDVKERQQALRELYERGCIEWDWTLPEMDALCGLQIKRLCGIWDPDEGPLDSRKGKKLEVEDIEQQAAHNLEWEFHEHSPKDVYVLNPQWLHGAVAVQDRYKPHPSNFVNCMSILTQWKAQWSEQYELQHASDVEKEEEAAADDDDPLDKEVAAMTANFQIETRTEV